MAAHVWVNQTDRILSTFAHPRRAYRLWQSTANISRVSHMSQVSPAGIPSASCSPRRARREAAPSSWVAVRESDGMAQDARRTRPEREPSKLTLVTRASSANPLAQPAQRASDFCVASDSTAWRRVRSVSHADVSLPKARQRLAGLRDDVRRDGGRRICANTCTHPMWDTRSSLRRTKPAYGTIYGPGVPHLSARG